jgi:hypothetical protein
VRSGQQQRHPSKRSAAGQGARSCVARGGHAAATACDCRSPGSACLNLRFRARWRRLTGDFPPSKTPKLAQIRDRC